MFIIIWLAFCLFLHMCVHSRIKANLFANFFKIRFLVLQFSPSLLLPYPLQCSLPLVPSLLPPFSLPSPVVPLPPSLLHTIHGLNLIIHLLHFSLHQSSIGGIGLDLSIPGSKGKKGDITDAVRPTIWLYMLCRRYSIWIRSICLMYKLPRIQ